MKTAALLVASLLATTVYAAPRSKAAKKEFAKGVAAYQNGDFAAASTALGKSYKLEPDTETLFAWAQSERQQNKCESAIDLYNQLLAKDMPAANKDAVRTKLEECKTIIAANKPVEPPPKVVVEPPKKVLVEEPAPVPVPVQEEPPQVIVKETRKPWYKDPLGDSLTIAGVVSLGVGGYFLYSGKQAEDKSQESDALFEEQQDKAESHGRLGVVFTVAGGVLIVSGIVRYMTRPTQESSTQLTGWVDKTSGGVAAFGRF
jgi:outer membrane biosynthesis protein TonB